MYEFSVCLPCRPHHGHNSCGRSLTGDSGSCEQKRQITQGKIMFVIIKMNSWVNTNAKNNKCVQWWWLVLLCWRRAGRGCFVRWQDVTENTHVHTCHNVGTHTHTHTHTWARTHAPSDLNIGPTLQCGHCRHALAVASFSILLRSKSNCASCISPPHRSRCTDKKVCHATATAAASLHVVP